jgi:cytochrome c5
MTCATALVRLTFLVLLAWGATGCDHFGRSGSASDWKTLGLQMPPAIQAADLPDSSSRGGHLVGRYCSQCHGIPSPKSHSAADWTPTFRRMLQRMAHSSMMGPSSGMMMPAMPMGMHGARVPTPEEADTMLAYLQDHALAAVSPADLPEAGSSDAQVFTSTCAGCHALPSPEQHLASEWPGVVARMRQHARELQVPEITDAQAGSILAYLRRTARNPQSNDD